MPAIRLNIRGDLKKFERFLTAAQRKAIPKARRISINKTINVVNTQVVRALAAHMGLKVKDVKPAITKTKARNRSPVGRIVARGKALNLIRFVPTAKRKVGVFRNKKGVIAKVFGKATVKEGTFIGNQGRTVFKRKSGSKSKRNPNREALEPFFGPAIPVEFARNVIASRTRARARTEWPVQYRRALKFAIRKIK